jgi:hypothetical protein
VGHRIGPSVQSTADGDFKAIAYRAEGCLVGEKSSYFGVFGERPQVVGAAVAEVSNESLAKAKGLVGCANCEDFVKVDKVTPVVAGFGTSPSLPVLLSFPIKSYSDNGRVAGPLVLVSKDSAVLLPGWCNGRPLLLQFARHRIVAYVTGGCDNGEFAFNAFDLSGPLPRVVLQDGRFGT